MILFALGSKRGVCGTILGLFCSLKLFNNLRNGWKALMSTGADASFLHGLVCEVVDRCLKLGRDFLLQPYQHKFEALTG